MGDISISLFAGLRYNEETKELDKVTSAEGLRVRLANNAIILAQPIGGGQFAIIGDARSHTFTGLERDEDRVTWSANTQWDITPDAMLYASVGTGYKGGGYDSGYSGPGERIRLSNSPAGVPNGLSIAGTDHSGEGMYFHAYHDGKGELLNGGEDYTLHFPADYLPPVKAFWSLTAYTDDYNLVENDSGRYSVGDRSRGLKYNPDGSLTIHVQFTTPAEGASNWLPTPEGDLFRVNFRMYMPKPVMKEKDKLEAYLPPLVKQA